MQVNHWVSRARPGGDYKPPIDDLDKFVASYRLWFNALNPSWRARDDAGRWMASGDGPWVDLKKPGPNGLLSLLACLKWWIDKEESLGMEVPVAWVEAVADLIWVMQELILTMPKRAR